MTFSHADIERFWAKVDTAAVDECWEWQAYREPNGYGRLQVNGTSIRAHRIAWQLAHGPIARGEGHHGTCVCHHCDNPSCCNPAHLFLGTMADNVRDRDRKGRQRCRQGANHPRGMAKLTPEIVRAIRRDRAEGVTVQALAEQHGVSAGVVSQAANRKAWAHV